MAFVVIILAFVTGMLLVGAAGSFGGRSPLKSRLDDIARPNGYNAGKYAPTSPQFTTSFSARLVYPMLRSCAKLVERFISVKSVEATRFALSQAGHPLQMGVAEFNGVRVCSVIASAVLAVFACRLLDTTPVLEMGLWVLCLLFGFALPDTLLQRHIAARRAKIRRSLPETIDLLIVSVEAGMGFDGAISKVVAKMRGPLPEELERGLQEMRLGKSRLQALKDMATRIALPEMSAFVAAIYQADQLGVSIARVLHVQSDAIRTARIQRMREASAKLPVKMLFPLVFFIFPAIFIVMLGPSMIRILKSF